MISPSHAKPNRRGAKKKRKMAVHRRPLFESLFAPEKKSTSLILNGSKVVSNRSARPVENATVVDVCTNGGRVVYSRMQESCRHQSRDQAYLPHTEDEKLDNKKKDAKKTEKRLQKAP